MLHRKREAFAARATACTGGWLPSPPGPAREPYSCATVPAPPRACGCGLPSGAGGRIKSACGSRGAAPDDAPRAPTSTLRRKPYAASEEVAPSANGRFAPARPPVKTLRKIHSQRHI